MKKYKMKGKIEEYLEKIFYISHFPEGKNSKGTRDLSVELNEAMWISGGRTFPSRE